MTGATLRQLRLSRGLTQVQLAKLLGYGWRYISHIETETVPMVKHFENHVRLLFATLPKKREREETP
jgi:transcriptional regulator with XRE-family HTH domain